MDGEVRAMKQERIDEIAEQVCWALQLPIRGVAFLYIENAIRAALEEQAMTMKARMAALEQLNRDLTTGAVNNG